MDHRCSFANRIRQGCVVVAIQVLATASTLTRAAPNDSDCRVEVGRVVSRQGTVEVRHGAGAWVAAKRESVLCDGDAVRTGRHARAALFIRPENIVRLDQNTAVNLRVNDAETLVEFFTNEQRVSAGPDCGAAYFVSRFPRRFKVRTHYVNAEIEGTEFLVRAACEATTVAVYEGAVRTTELATERVVTLKALEQLTVGPAYRQSIPVRIQPRDGVQWTIRLPAPEGDATNGACSGVRCAVRDAWDLVRAGRLDEATSALASMARTPDASADALALQAIVLMARGQRDEAVAAARRATDVDRNSLTAWLALSYAEQSRQSFPAALGAARHAAQVAPANAIAIARIAEILLAQGEIPAAVRESERAVDTDPDNAVALTTRGFVELAARHTERAEADFARAIDIDSDDPRAHLGLGLARIRAGRAADGRQALEIALALDPADATVRTYLGRAHLAVGSRARDIVAREQLQLASGYDPADPTPHRYLATEARSGNRMVDAVEADQRAMELNRNRTALRPADLLAEDASIRSLDAAATYREFGFERLARLEATRGLLTAPADASAHRFLSSSLSRSDREDPVRVSELLQSQLLQDIGAPLPSPAEPYSGIGRQPGSEALRPGLQEYSGIFDRTGTAARLAALGGTQGTLSDEIAVAHSSDRVSVGLGQYFYRTNGIRPNNDTMHRIHNVSAQWAVMPGVSVLGEFRQRNTSNGDIAFAGDPDTYTPELRQSSRDRVARVGLRLSPRSTTDVLVSLSHSDIRGRDFRANPFLGGEMDTRADESGTYLDTSVIHRMGQANFVAGANRYGTRFDSDQQFIPGPCPFPACTLNTRNTRTNIHFYGTYRFGASATVLLGASHERIRDVGLRLDIVNPKIGLMWSPVRSFVARFATFQSVRPALMADQSLEPAQILGQGQVYNDVVSTIAQVRSLAIDYLPTPLAHAGVEVTHRKLRDPYEKQSATPYFSRPTEDRLTVHGRMGFGRGVSIGLEWTEERYRRPPADADLNFTARELRSRLVPLDARWFIGKGVVLGATVTRVRQEITSDYLNPGQAPTSEFTLVDASIGYRLPARAGFISLDVRNAFDRRFEYQDVNFLSAVPLVPRFLPARSVFARLVLFL